jgi:hypothetical protein
MLELSIKTLEYQKGLLTPSKKEGESDAAESKVENPFLNPAMWPWPYGQANAPAQSDASQTAAEDKKTASAKTSKSTSTSKKTT